MKKNMIVGIALAVGILSAGAFSASAATTSCCSDGGCADGQAYQQFTKESDALTSDLQVKKVELYSLYGFDSFDSRKVDALEADIKALKDKIKVVANKYKVSSCCRG